MIEEIKQLNDQDLVKLSLESPYHFAHIMEKYQGKLSGYLHKISNLSQESIEDLLQEIFIKVYKNLNNYDADLSFSSWIYRIAHNHFIDHIRKEKKKINVSLDKDDMALFLPSNENINNALENKDCWENITAIIDKLPNKYKEVLVLRFVEEKSYEEIMDILEKPKGSIATLIKRGRALIEKELEKEKIICL